MLRFQHFACIDWSGAKTRWHKGIAIALCDRDAAAPNLVEPPDLHWTRGHVLAWLQQQAASEQDMLIGLDLSFALPFADADAYFPTWVDSPTDAERLWQQVDRLSAADEHLSATGFVQHPEISRHFRQHRACGDLFGAGRGRMRVCESDGQALIEGINPYSCFNLVGAAQVGKSSLTGMRVLHRLGGSIPIWPFDPLPEKGPVLVEIYTSIAARASGLLPKGKSKITDPQLLDAALGQFASGSHKRLAGRYTDHATDAILTAAWLRHVSDQPTLWSPAKLSPAIARTEGWTFGVL
jgi:hypothetical protein